MLGSDSRIGTRLVHVTFKVANLTHNIHGGVTLVHKSSRGYSSQLGKSDEAGNSVFCTGGRARRMMTAQLPSGS